MVQYTSSYLILFSLSFILNIKWVDFFFSFFLGQFFILIKKLPVDDIIKAIMVKTNWDSLFVDFNY